MKGVVVDRATGQPVTDVLVSLWDPQAPADPVEVTVTGGGGEFDTAAPIMLRHPGIGREVTRYVLRVHRSPDLAKPVFGELLYVGMPTQGKGSVRDPGVAVYVEDAFAEHDRRFARVLDPLGRPLSGVDVTCYAAKSGRTVARTDVGGYVALPLEAVGPSSGVRVTCRVGDVPLAADWPKDADREADLTLAGLTSFGVEGRVTATDTGSGIGGLVVDLLDRSGVWENPVATATTAASGDFGMSFPQWTTEPPRATFVVRSGARRVAALDREDVWAAGPEGVVELGVAAADVPTLRLDGQVLHRTSRRPVAGVGLEVWTAGPGTLLRTATSGPDGGFATTLAPGADGTAPDLLLRAYADGRLVAEQAVHGGVWTADERYVFLEVDVAAVAPTAFRVTGRVLQPGGSPSAGVLRVEAWDRSPRSGGLLGAAAYPAADGSFEVVLPAAPGADSTTVPNLVFRVYAGDVLAGTTDGQVTWGPNGTGTALVEVDQPLADRGEVVLHELGETIADAVNRMQGQLSRYPSTVGTYVVDELDLTVPVAARVDALGQIRARVVEQAPADAQIGQMRLRVRPALGVQGPVQEALPQPLSALSELTTAMVGALNARRVYSVEDLVRLAQQPAGREALGSVLPGVDLAALLAKAALLAAAMLPAAVREALVALGCTGLEDFAGRTDAEALADDLSARLGQPITAADVQEWQRRVERALAVPLPTDA